MALNIIGISAHFHDAACCLMRDGQLVVAAEEERFTRIKHDPSIPTAAFRYCLQKGGIGIDRVDLVAYYEDPTFKLGRQLWMGLPGLNTYEQAVTRLNPQRPIAEIREKLGFDGPVEIIGHHLSHAASSFF